jgi:hypothetical protein
MCNVNINAAKTVGSRGVTVIPRASWGGGRTFARRFSVKCHMQPFSPESTCRTVVVVTYLTFLL